MSTGSSNPTRPTLAQRLLRKGFRPLYPFYYRFLWGAQFPGNGALERAVRAWEDLSTRGDAPQSAEAWDEQYQQGGWDLLQDEAETPRYESLVELWSDWSRPGTLLDVGAGDAVLRPFLPDDSVRYVGLDLSAEAVARGQARLRPGDELIVADAETWSPPGPVETVLLNECVYYFEDPLGTVGRYFNCLKPGGVLIVSMFATPRSRAIRRRLVAVRPPAHETLVATKRGTWWMGVFGPE